MLIGLSYIGFRVYVYIAIAIVCTYIAIVCMYVCIYLSRYLERPSPSQIESDLGFLFPFFLFSFLPRRVGIKIDGWMDR